MCGPPAHLLGSVCENHIFFIRVAQFSCAGAYVVCTQKQKSRKKSQKIKTPVDARSPPVATVLLPPPPMDPHGSERGQLLPACHRIRVEPVHPPTSCSSRLRRRRLLLQPPPPHPRGSMRGMAITAGSGWGTVTAPRWLQLPLPHARSTVAGPPPRTFRPTDSHCREPTSHCCPSP